MNDMGGRQYQRGEHFHVIAKISQDEQVWKDANVNNLSSGGLRLITSDKFEKGVEIHFDLHIQGFFSDFDIKCKGVIRNERLMNEQYEYGVSFVGLSADKRVMIDENVQNDRLVGRSPYVQDK